MIERKRGHIVNISSVAGKTARPFGVGYAATKHGLVGFSWSLRAELYEHGIGVSVVCPGYVTGEGMFAEREGEAGPPPRTLKACTPEDVAKATMMAIEKNKADVVVGPPMLRIADVMTRRSVDFVMSIGRLSGSYAYARKEATGEGTE